MLKEYLDNETYNLITKNFNFNDITEIRLRTNKPIIIVVKNKKFFLKNKDMEYVVATKFLIDNFIKKICDNSIYAYSESIINGYITLKNGIRVGLCGQVVNDGDKVTTIKDFQSVNIRIPHFVKNCSLKAYDFIIDDEINNTLIISPPGAGKTTFLRDLVYQMAQHNISKNVLIADERNEICSVSHGECEIDLGAFCDIYTNCSKKFAFKNGIRSMRPDVIVTDEIDLDADLKYIIEAINSGVNVIATIHAKNLTELKNKTNFDEVINKKYFKRFIILSCDEGPGTLTEIYDEKLNCIYFRWYMKVVLIVVLIIVVMIISFSVAGQYKDRCDFYYNLKLFLNKLKLNLSYKQDKLKDFLKTTNSQKQFKIFINDYDCYLKTGNLNLSNIKILDSDEIIQLETYIKSIGNYDAKNELGQLDTFLVEIENKLEKVNEDKKKLYPIIIKLSFLFAIALGIILI